MHHLLLSLKGHFALGPGLGRQGNFRYNRGVDSKKSNKRQSDRFPPEPNTLAWVITDVASDDFRSGSVALVLDEGHEGCGLVVLNGNDFIVGETYRLLVGKLAPLTGRVRWKRELEPGIYRIGIEFLD